MEEKLSLSFRRATEEDVDAFLSLDREVAKDKTYSGFSDRAEALEEMMKNEVYLIYKDGVFVGNVEFQDKSPEEGYVSGVAVRPDFQGQGIGKRALEFVLEKMKDKKRIDIVVHPKNEKALRLYESFGFRKEGGQMENYYGDGEPRLMLALVR